MGFLLHIFVAIGVQALGEADVVLGWRAPWALPLLAVVPYALAGAVRRRALEGRFATAARLERVLGLSAPALHFVAVWACGWIQSVRDWTGSRLVLSSWPEPALLLALAPYLLFELAAIDASTRSHDLRGDERRDLRAFQLRMFCSAFAPLLLYIALASAVGASEVVRAHVQHVAVWDATFVATLFVVLTLTLPLLLRNTWDTVPLPSGLQRDVLEAVASRAGLRLRELLVWRTGNSMANAAIVGLLPATRVVLFSDSLLSILSLRELAAVFGHEIGHARRHHVLIFLAWALVFFLGADFLTDHVLPDGVWAAGGLLAVAFVAWYLVFGWLSRRFELEADLYSIELLGDGPAMIGALERVGGRLRDVASWRHFSTADRVAFLYRTLGDPELVRRFRSRLRRYALSGAVLALVVVALEVWSLGSSWGSDQLYVDLSLGRYAAAQERVQRASDVAPELAQLVERASRLEPAVDADELALLAAGALGRGALDDARVLADLAVLRGREDLLPLREALLAAREEGLVGEEAFASDEAPRWRAKLLERSAARP